MTASPATRDEPSEASNTVSRDGHLPPPWRIGSCVSSVILRRTALGRLLVPCALLLSLSAGLYAKPAQPLAQSPTGHSSSAAPPSTQPSPAGLSANDGTMLAPNSANTLEAQADPSQETVTAGGTARVKDPSAGPTSDVSASSERAWRKFRRGRPLHAQGIATGPLDGTKIVVIVAEPPPHITFEAMQSLLRADAAAVMKTPIGFDGWVADAVFELPVLGPSELSKRLSELAVLLYGTQNGAYAVPVALTEHIPTTRGLDVCVGAEDLRRWLFDETARLKPDSGGQASTAASLVNSPSRGLFHSDPPGLIVWAIPHNEALERHAIDCRTWLLKADLVLGGVSGPGSVLLLGRLRQSSLEDLPPLRVDEVLRLAATTSSELYQSYERRHPLAGRFADGARDWAPILLSPELIDTEFGSLLNVTDQLLKCWSQAGGTTYENFDYPTPKDYPFKGPVSDLTGSAGVTFNWNTSGVGYELTWPDGVSIFALHRTGALPVSYIPSTFDEDDLSTTPTSKGIRDLEERAYEYFATSGDVNLARVVQYTALYQLFRAHGVVSHVALKTRVPTTGEQAFAKALVELLNEIHAADDNVLEGKARTAAERLAGLFGEGMSEEDRLLWLPFEQRRCRACLTALRADLNAGAREYGVAYVNRLAAVLASGRADERLQRVLRELNDSRAQDDTEENLASRLASLTVTEREILDQFSVLQFVTAPDSPCTSLFQSVADIGAIKDSYSLAFQQRPSAWVRTPSVVVSRNVHNVLAVGGHNIGSAVPKVVVDSSRRPGFGVVEHSGGRRVLRVHPDDAIAVRGATPTIARTADNAALRAAIASAKLRSPKRQLPEALKLGGDGGGGRLPPGSLRLGAGHADEPSSAFVRWFGDPEAPSARVLDDAMLLNGQRVFRANTRASIAEVLSARLSVGATNVKRTLELELPGEWTDGDVRGLLGALRARSPGNMTIEALQGAPALRRVQVDATRATLTDVSTSKLQRTVEGTLPTLDPSVGPIRLRIEVSLDQGTTNIEGAIRQVFEATKAGGKSDLEQVIRPLRERLQNDPDVFDLLMQIRSEELGTLTITHAIWGHKERDDATARAYAV